MRLPKGFSIVPYKDVVIGRLYQTNIFTIDYNKNTLTLNSNGWQTKHTKKCLNLGLNKFGVYVYQEKFNWYVTHNGTTVPFTDNMVLSQFKTIDVAI